MLFFNLQEMEGITHFFSHHLDHLPCLLNFLAAIEAPNSPTVHDLAEFLRTRSGGTWDADALVEFFGNMSSEDREKVQAWDDDYSGRTEEMWARAKEFVRRRHNVDFD